MWVSRIGIEERSGGSRVRNRRCKKVDVTYLYTMLFFFFTQSQNIQIILSKYHHKANLLHTFIFTRLSYRTHFREHFLLTNHCSLPVNRWRLCSKNRGGIQPIEKPSQGANLRGRAGCEWRALVFIFSHESLSCFP